MKGLVYIFEQFMRLELLGEGIQQHKSRGYLNMPKPMTHNYYDNCPNRNAAKHIADKSMKPAGDELKDGEVVTDIEHQSTVRGRKEDFPLFME